MEVVKTKRAYRMELQRKEKLVQKLRDMEVREVVAELEKLRKG